jgi:hypothetical protein
MERNLVIKIRCALWLLVRGAPRARRYANCWGSLTGDDWGGPDPNAGKGDASEIHMSVPSHPNNPQVISILRGESGEYVKRYKRDR